MRAVSTHPTVASLREPFSVGRPPVDRPPIRRRIENALIALLDGAMRPGTVTSRGRSINTPFGPGFAEFEWRGPRRRIALLSAVSPEMATSILVYGGYDAVYVVGADALLTHTADIATCLLQAEPRVFVSETPAGPNDDRGSTIRVRYDGPEADLVIGRYRLNRASDWADVFERALAPTDRLSAAAS